MHFDLISIGCLSLDTVYEVPILPKSNSECFVKRLYEAHGGGAANVAAYAGFYGGLQVGLVSRIGNDKEGEDLITRMKQYNVCLEGVHRTKDHPISTRIAIISDSDHNRTYLVYLGPINELSVKDVPSGYVTDSTLFYVAPAPPKVQQQFVEFAVERRKMIALNPGKVYFEEGSKDEFRKLIRSVDFLFLNGSEALEYSNADSPDEAGLILQKLGAKRTIITLGRKGCIVCFDGKIKSYPGYRVEQIGSAGAGDAFAAGFLTEFTRTQNLDSAAISGNVFGAFSMTQHILRHPTPDKGGFSAFLSTVKQKNSL